MTIPVAGFNKNPQNINRNGPPKKDWTMKGLLEESLEEADETGTPYKKIVARKLRNLAVKGDMVAIKEVNNRMDGMPVQPNAQIPEDQIDDYLHIYKPEKNEK
jgi:hypothetical protein